MNTKTNKNPHNFEVNIIVESFIFQHRRAYAKFRNLFGLSKNYAYSFLYHHDFSGWFRFKFIIRFITLQLELNKVSWDDKEWKHRITLTTVEYDEEIFAEIWQVDENFNAKRIDTQKKI